MTPRTPAKLRELKLGRQKAAGLVEPLPSDQRRYRNAVCVDPRLEPAEWLDAAVHELLHINFPFLSEEAVTAAGTHMAQSLWTYGVRRVSQ